MVVYKAQNVYDNWEKDGPKGKLELLVPTATISVVTCFPNRI